MDKKMILLIVVFLIIGILLGFLTNFVIKGNATNIFKNVDNQSEPIPEKDRLLTCPCGNGVYTPCYANVGCSTCCERKLKELEEKEK